VKGSGFLLEFSKDDFVLLSFSDDLSILVEEMQIVDGLCLGLDLEHLTVIVHHSIYISSRR
jgi:hypothetical protein